MGASQSLQSGDNATVMGSSQSLQSAVGTISYWDSEPKERLIFECAGAQVRQYLQAVNKVQQSGNSEELKNIVSMAVSRLRHEFQIILTRQTEGVMGSVSVSELSASITDSTSYQFRYEEYVAYEVPSTVVVDYLRSIAEWMSSSGHLGGCIEVYKGLRKSCVETIFKRFRLEELQAGDTKRFLWEEVKMKTERWSQAAKVCTKILFAKEKQLAKRVFGGLGTSAETECFLYTVKDAATNLLSFPKVVSLSRQPSERLEIMLILHEALSSIILDLNALFQSDLESAKAVRDGATAILSRLQDEVRRMLADFENAVLNDLSEISDDTGVVHKSTKYVMEYINLILKYRKLLMNLIVSRPTMPVGNLKIPDNEVKDPNNLSPLALHLILIIAVLRVNLESKSKNYKDASLGYLFMMNNVQYIAKKAQCSRELQEMIGADYLKKLTENVKQSMSRYQAQTSARFLDCFTDKGLYVTRCFSSRVSKSALRRRVQTFNGVFEGVKQSQSKWEIPDLSLKEELRRSMSEMLLPAYDGFLKKFRSHMENGMERKACIHHFQKVHIRYSVQDLEALVFKDLFAGNQLSPLSDVPAESIDLEYWS